MSTCAVHCSSDAHLADSINQKACRKHPRVFALTRSAFIDVTKSELADNEECSKHAGPRQNLLCCNFQSGVLPGLWAYSVVMQLSSHAVERQSDMLTFLHCAQVEVCFAHSASVMTSLYLSLQPIVLHLCYGLSFLQHTNIIQCRRACNMSCFTKVGVSSHIC